ncbi:hypothetical protein E2605_07810 [Dysgonomonas capnocytophagoides]|uniref:Uncharacterized protein n=1 Tax=Dysgonomonas capnocytophagoides TaxID=45254 RepID=A0A4Y8L352_9BACT|nr:hypothetical protein [Dysgonomonas capnocytophagoides]TFD96717.1 hypothetical protein E2605_07810 [Dysgonomonas capnocytophagoides]
MKGNITDKFFIAGFHGSDSMFTEAYQNQDFTPGNYVKFLDACEYFEKGDDSRMKGEKCPCLLCNRIHQTSNFYDIILRKRSTRELPKLPKQLQIEF